MMERAYEKGPKGLGLWYCNPELNTECDKRMCKYNPNSEIPLCEATTKKEFALKIGEIPGEKSDTPGQNNS